MEASLASELDCDQLDYERHCIRAAHGVEIKEQPWADVFRALKWYQPEVDRSEKDLGKVTLENIAQLEKLGKECRRTLTIEKKLATAWTKIVLAGRPAVPAVSFDCISESECTPISKREMRALLLDGPKWTLVTTPDEMRRMAPSAEVSAALHGRKLSGIDIVFEGHCAVEEGCPRAFRLVFDAQHKFVAIEQLPVAACPFVYSLAGAPAFEGEILRDLNRPSLERDDSLTISSRPCSDVARFRISEEKDEVTSLDAVSLLVDGVAMSPIACASDDAPYCVNDGLVLRLARGDHLDLAFRIPPGAECDEIELRANGHYTPLR